MSFFADILGGGAKEPAAAPTPVATTPTVDLAELARQRTAKLSRQKNRDSLVVEATGTGTGLSIPK